MVREAARTPARGLARLGAARASPTRCAQSPGLVGARGHDAVRLWQSLQPPPDHPPAQGGDVLARRMGIRAAHAALQLAHPLAVAAVLGTARAVVVADLLRR